MSSWPPPLQDAYKTAIRTTRDAVIRPKPKYLPRPIWNTIVRRVVNFGAIPLGTITEITLSDGSLQANITLAGQKEGLNAKETSKT